MARALPHLTWFRAFECAARRLSFTAAATELGLTQSAVSQQVRSLEVRLGVTLFLRRPRGLALTDAGRRLLPEVSGAIAALAAATRAVEAAPAEGLVTVAASVSFAQWRLAPKLSAFLAQAPGLRVRIVSAVWPDDFHASAADVEVRYGSASLAGRNAERLLPDALVAVARPDAAPDPEALGARPLIEVVGGSGGGWSSWAEAAGYRGPLEPTTYVDSHGLAVDLARNGAGVALTSSLIAGPSLADGRLVQVHPARIMGADGYRLAVNGAGAPALRVAEWIRRILEDAPGLPPTCGAIDGA